MGVGPTFLSDDCQGFFRHWQSLCAEDQSVPLQTDFLSNPHPTYAPFQLIVDLMSDHLLIRLMGTELVERWGRDKTGEKVGDDQTPEVRDAIFKYA